VAAGAVVLVLGWLGVTGTPYSFEQIPYVVSGGLGGIFLLGVGAMLWTSADLRDEWRTLRELVEIERVRLAADEAARADQVARPDTPAAPGGAPNGLTAPPVRRVVAQP
jgi:hypothetical protein